MSILDSQVRRDDDHRPFPKSWQSLYIRFHLDRYRLDGTVLGQVRHLDAPIVCDAVPFQKPEM